MDDKKRVKEFINNICDWIEDKHKECRRNGFSYELTNDRMSYLIADKGIEKRIAKQLFKRLGLKSYVEYAFSPSPNEYLDGELKIKLISNNQFRETRSQHE